MTFTLHVDGPYDEYTIQTKVANAVGKRPDAVSVDPTPNNGTTLLSVTLESSLDDDVLLIQQALGSRLVSVEAAASFLALAVLDVTPPQLNVPPPSPSAPPSAPPGIPSPSEPPPPPRGPLGVPPNPPYPLIPPEASWPPNTQVVVQEAVEVVVTLEGDPETFLSDEGAYEEWEEETIERVAENAGVDPSYVTVRVIAGSMIVVVEIVMPPLVTPAQVTRNLDETILASDEAATQAFVPSVPTFLTGAVVTSTVIQERPILEEFPPAVPGPEFTETTIIILAIASVVGLFFLIFIARNCDADKLRETTRLFTSVYDRVTGRGGSEAKAPTVIIQAVPQYPPGSTSAVVRPTLRPTPRKAVPPTLTEALPIPPSQTAVSSQGPPQRPTMPPEPRPAKPPSTAAGPPLSEEDALVV